MVKSLETVIIVHRNIDNVGLSCSFFRNIRKAIQVGHKNASLFSLIRLTNTFARNFKHLKMIGNGLKETEKLMDWNIDNADVGCSLLTNLRKSIQVALFAFMWQTSTLITHNFKHLWSSDKASGQRPNSDCHFWRLKKRHSAERDLSCLIFLLTNPRMVIKNRTKNRL